MTEIRSFRRVFDLERRVYSVDRMRLNPTGVPVRGVLYLLAAMAAALLASAVPGVGRVLGIVPWYLRDLGLPGALAAGLALVRIDGRPFHVAGAAIVRRRLRPRRLSGLSGRSSTGERWWPPAIVMLPDGSDPSFRRMRFVGPGAVLVQREHVREGPRPDARAGFGPRRGALRLRTAPAGGRGDGANSPARRGGRGDGANSPARRGGRGDGANAPARRGGRAVIALAPGVTLEVLGERRGR